jgi:mono/diheme cytochrome c family protein
MVCVAAYAVQAVGGDKPQRPQISEEAHKAKDPLPKAKTNLVAGAGIYQENCSGCHGPSGVPVKRFRNLERQPATLTSDMLKSFSDGDLAWILQHGAEGGMPSFAEDLTETQRWQCIQFVRRLGKDATKYSDEYAAQPTGKASH